MSGLTWRERAAIRQLSRKLGLNREQRGALKRNLINMKRGKTTARQAALLQAIEEVRHDSAEDIASK